MKKLDKLNQVQNSESFRQRVLLRLAKIGIKEADAIFHSDQTLYAGVNDVEMLEPQWIDNNTISVVAKGNAVTFIEFGTGVFYDTPHPRADEMGAIRGEYGKQKGKQTAWGYYGDPGNNGKIVRQTVKGDVVVTRGNPPAKAMYNSSKLIRSKIIEIIREELRK